MSNESFWTQFTQHVVASTAVTLAFWGALGGATIALTTKMRVRDALRHIVLGGIIAAGMGSVSGALIGSWLGLPEGIFAAGGAVGSAAYLVGIFGASLIELLLARIRALRRKDDA